MRLSLIPKRFQFPHQTNHFAEHYFAKCGPKTSRRSKRRQQHKVSRVSYVDKFDLSRISAADAAARGDVRGKSSAIRAANGTNLIRTMSLVRDDLDRLLARREPRVAQRPADRERAMYLSGKRARWMKAARRAKRNSRRKYRKVPQLDEFDDRIDRPILSQKHGVIGRNVRRF